MKVVDQIAHAKLAAASPLRDVTREDFVLQRIRALATELGLDAARCEQLFRDIMEMSVARQERLMNALPQLPLRVSFLGEEGSWSHLAARKRYAGRPQGALLTGLASFSEIVDAVLSGTADVGLMPIENTTAGSINETYDLLAERPVFITAEVVNPIEHKLLGLPGASRDQLRLVLSHPQALKQSEAFLRGMPQVKTRADLDTSTAAKRVRDGGDITVGAIGSEEAARRYGLEVLSEISIPGGNFTRFVELSRAPLAYHSDQKWKSSLLVTLNDEPGALAQVLRVFAERSINLFKLESRPLPQAPFRYRFYVDIDGHAESQNVAAAIRAATTAGANVRVLGSYPPAG